MIRKSPPLPIRKIGYPKDVETIGYRPPPLSILLRDVCQSFETTIEILRDQKLTAEKYVYPRRIFFYIANVLTGESSTKIAATLHRDRGTYWAHIKNVEKWFEINEDEFMTKWAIYTSNSKLWGKYYDLKKYNNDSVAFWQK